jgi:hypothetical protein
LKNLIPQGDDLVRLISKALNVEAINNTLKIDVNKLINDSLNA